MQTSGGHWDRDRSGGGEQGKTSNTLYARENQKNCQAQGQGQRETSNIKN